MQNYFFWTFVLAVLAVLCAGAAIFLRAYLTGATPASLLFRPKGERRLEVVDQASLDGKRRLVLIRRDDVEHLLLTGGPVDVVVETGIDAMATRPVIVTPNEPQPQPRRAPVFTHGSEAAPPMLATRER